MKRLNFFCFLIFMVAFSCLLFTPKKHIDEALDSTKNNSIYLMRDGENIVVSPIKEYCILFFKKSDSGAVVSISYAQYWYLESTTRNRLIIDMIAMELLKSGWVPDENFEKNPDFYMDLNTGLYEYEPWKEDSYYNEIHVEVDLYHHEVKGALFKFCGSELILPQFIKKMVNIISVPIDDQK